MSATANQIIVRVLKGSHSLVFLSKSFGDTKILGTYLKDKDGKLERVHGKSATAARSFLNGTSDVVRSYGHSTLTKTQGEKVKSSRVFMTEFSLFNNIVDRV